MPRAGSSVIGSCGTVRTMIPTSGCAWRMLDAALAPLTRPWSSQSMITTSGRKSPTAARARSPSPMTSTIWIWDWAISSERTCDATCGTSSIIRSRILLCGTRLLFASFEFHTPSR